MLASPKVEFFGYEFTKEGIKPQSKLTSTINSFKRPETKKELKCFLDLVGFYRDFIPNFGTTAKPLNRLTGEFGTTAKPLNRLTGEFGTTAKPLNRLTGEFGTTAKPLNRLTGEFGTTAKPLNRLTGENVHFEWSEDCEIAFNDLKQELQSEPVLAFSRCGEPFIAEVDASDVAVGGVLSPIGEDNKLHPVAYFSTTLQKSQRNWSPHTKEAYALILAIRHQHLYLTGLDFILKTDHNPLVHFRKQKEPRGKYARWISELEDYNYTIEYIPGTLKVKADDLLRIDIYTLKP